MKRHVRLRPIQAVSLLAVAALMACAEDASGPQFANEPAPTRPPTVAVSLSSPAAQTQAPAIATPASLGDLLASRGSPGRVYVVSDGSIWTIASDGQATRTSALPPDTRVVDLDTSPDSGQVALLLATRGSRTTDQLQIVDAAGGAVRPPQSLGAGVATPGAVDSAAAESLDWSPQGDRILASLRDGTIVIIDLEGESTPEILRAGTEGERILDPAWSPTGQTIAYIAGKAEGNERALRTLDVATGRTSDVVPAMPERTVVDFAWLPDGRSLLFTEGGQPGGAVTGIDLWRIQSDGTGRGLVASAGTVAPVARLALARPSPDGRSVAYVALVPGSTGALFDSLWVRDLTSGVGFRVDLPEAAAINALWWTDAGLAVAGLSAPDEGSGGLLTTLWLVDRDGIVRRLWVAPLPAATPVAATPGATPAGGSSQPAPAGPDD